MSDAIRMVNSARFVGCDRPPEAYPKHALWHSGVWCVVQSYEGGKYDVLHIPSGSSALSWISGEDRALQAMATLADEHPDWESDRPFACSDVIGLSAFRATCEKLRARFR